MFSDSCLGSRAVHWIHWWWSIYELKPKHHFTIYLWITFTVCFWDDFFFFRKFLDKKNLKIERLFSWKEQQLQWGTWVVCASPQDSHGWASGQYRGVWMSALLSPTVSVCTLRNIPTAQAKAAPEESRIKPHQQRSQRSQRVALLGPGCLRVTRRPWSRRHARHQSCQHCSPGAVLPDRAVLTLTNVTGTMESTDSFHSNSTTHSPTGRAGHGRSLGHRHSRWDKCQTAAKRQQDSHVPSPLPFHLLLSTSPLGVLGLGACALLWCCHHTVPVCPELGSPGQGKHGTTRAQAWPSTRGGTAGFPGGTHNNRNKTNPETQITRGEGWKARL